MTVKPTVSLTDPGHASARSLVDGGRFASLSAVIQYGLGLVEREEETDVASVVGVGGDEGGDFGDAGEEFFLFGEGDEADVEAAALPIGGEDGLAQDIGHNL